VTYLTGVYVGGVLFSFAVMVLHGIGREPVGTTVWRAGVTAVLWPFVIAVGLLGRFRGWQEAE
jgi:NADH:ubiquinone oxidoreductase subunit 6 (subunit J)